MAVMVKVCPKCGELNPWCTYCTVCHTELIETSYEHQWCDPYAQQIYEEYVFNSPEYDEEMFQKRIEHDKEIEKLSHAPSKSTKLNIPKCPTCSSTDVEKISTTSKAVGFITVGVFSKNFGKTFRCKKCGYRW